MADVALAAHEAFAQRIEALRDNAAQLTVESLAYGMTHALSDLADNLTGDAAVPAPTPADAEPKRDAHGFTDAEHDTLITLIDRNAKRVGQLLTLRAGVSPQPETGDAAYWYERAERLDRERADWKRWCEEREATIEQLRARSPQPEITRDVEEGEEVYILRGDETVAVLISVDRFDELPALAGGASPEGADRDD